MRLPGLLERKTAKPASELATEIVVDNFAGAGGASMGIEAAIGEAVYAAINHSPTAIDIHTINHPQTRHFCEDVWKVAKAIRKNPAEVTGGRPVALAWFSPDCTHFSTARGAKPVKKKIRCLAWVVIRWARECRPRVIMLENVTEFEGWGPLIHKRDAAGNVVTGPDGQPLQVPDPARKGETFRKWKAMLQAEGYQVEHRSLVAADYGVPTTRKRFFLIARRDGQPIVWPQRTHASRKEIAKARSACPIIENQRAFDGELGIVTCTAASAGNTACQRCAGRLKPWRSAAECIDWSIPCPSIFERKKPLAESTLRRIARGIERFVINAADPFIVPSEFVVTCNHGGDDARTRDIREPLHTLTASRDATGVVVPSLVRCAHGESSASGKRWGSGTEPIEHPLPTVTGSKDFAVAAVHVTKFRQNSSGSEASEPLPTVTSGAGSARPAGAAHALGVVSAHLSSVGGSGYAGKPRDVEVPLNTVKTDNRQSVVSATLVQTGYGEREGQAPRALDVEQPLGTCVGTGKAAVVEAFLQRFKFGESEHVKPQEPMQTVCAQGNHHAVVTATLMTNTSGHAPSDVAGPVPTLTSGGQQAVVSATVVGVGGRAGQSPERSAEDPVATVTAKGDKAVVTANMVRIGQTGSNGACVGDARDPVGTVVSKNEQLVAAASLTKLYGTSQHGADVGEPMPTVTGQGGHVAEVRAFLTKYYKTGSRDQALDEPMHTVTSKARLGLVTIHNTDYQITDIGLRMLRPEELLRAQFGKYADEYVLIGSQATRIAAIGNSVCPEVAEALVRANVRIRRVG